MIGRFSALDPIITLLENIMAFAPVALIMPQYDRTLYAGFWLKAYSQGTTTPLNFATDATGGTTLVKAELDTQGFPLTAGSARFIPFISGDYDLWMFPTEAEADANDTTNAIQLADNLNADPDSTGQLSLWDTTLTYNIPEIILGSDDNYYRSIIDSNSGNNPTSSPVQWELLSFGRIWNTNITYAIGDSVYGSDGHLYVALVSQSGNDPISDATNWDASMVFSDVLDEDDMSSDSDTEVATQQSIKAYVDGHLVYLSTPEVITPVSTTVNSWHTQSITTLATVNARAAILVFDFIGQVASGSISNSKVYARETGSGLGLSGQTVKLGGNSHATGTVTNHQARATGEFTVTLDSSQDFDYYINNNVFNFLTITLVGYLL